MEYLSLCLSVTPHDGFHDTMTMTYYVTPHVAVWT